MVKVLIVDDEILVRVGLKSCINWEKNGFSIVGEADNGEQGLELCEQLKPDVVLCDIKMPAMNGVELIRILGAKYPQVRIIVLSGYDDYEYVRETMKLGVVDYILKLSLKPEELLDILKSIKGQIEEERFKNSIRTHNTDLCSISSIDTADIIKKIITNEELLQNEEDFLRNKMPFLCTGQYVLICLRLDEYVEILKDSKGKDEEEFNMAVCNIIKQVLKSFSDCEVIKFGKGSYAAVISGRSITVDDFDEVGKALNDSLIMYVSISASVGISDFYNGIEKIKDAYRQAYFALSDRFYNGRKNIAVYGKMTWKADYSAIILGNDFERNLFNALEILDRKAAVECIENLFQDLSVQKKAMPIKIRDALKEIVFTFNRAAKCYNTDIYRLFNTSVQEIGESISGLEFLDDCKNWTMDLLEKFFNRIENYKMFSCRKEISIVKEYIHKNYYKRIDLEFAATLINMNKNYFSTLFSKETGLSFIEYLTNIRIDKAKELLREKDIKVLNVANQVGYNDEHYFSKVFKKVTGKSPADYKRLYEDI